MYKHIVNPLPATTQAWFGWQNIRWQETVQLAPYGICEQCGGEGPLGTLYGAPTCRGCYGQEEAAIAELVEAWAL